MVLHFFQTELNKKRLRNIEIWAIIITSMQKGGTIFFFFFTLFAA